MTQSKQDTGYFLPKVEIKDYNVMIECRNYFGQPVKSDIKHMKTFENLPQIKDMTVQLVACLIIHTPKKTTS